MLKTCDDNAGGSLGELSETANKLRKQNKDIAELMAVPQATSPNAPKALAKGTVPIGQSDLEDMASGSNSTGSMAFGSKDAEVNPLIAYLLPKEANLKLNPGGLASKEPAKARKVIADNPKQLAMGKQVESEHTPNVKKEKAIAADHLVEDPKYYTHLKAMESAVRKGKTIKTAEQTGMISGAAIPKPATGGADKISTQPMSSAISSATPPTSSSVAPVPALQPTQIKAAVAGGVAPAGVKPVAGKAPAMGVVNTQALKPQAPVTNSGNTQGLSNSTEPGQTPAAPQMSGEQARDTRHNNEAANAYGVPGTVMGPNAEPTTGQATGSTGGESGPTSPNNTELAAVQSNPYAAEQQAMTNETARPAIQQPAVAQAVDQNGIAAPDNRNAQMGRSTGMYAHDANGQETQFMANNAPGTQSGFERGSYNQGIAGMRGAEDQRLQGQPENTIVQNTNTPHDLGVQAASQPETGEQAVARINKQVGFTPGQMSSEQAGANWRASQDQQIAANERQHMQDQGNTFMAQQGSGPSTTELAARTQQPPAVAKTEQPLEPQASWAERLISLPRYKQADDFSFHSGNSQSAEREGSTELKPADEQAIVNFVTNNPNLDDDKFHEFVESRGIDPSAAEEVIYRRFNEDMNKNAELQVAFAIGAATTCKQAQLNTQGISAVCRVLRHVVPEFTQGIEMFEKAALVMPSMGDQRDHGQHISSEHSGKSMSNPQVSEAVQSMQSDSSTASQRFMTGVAARGLKKQKGKKSGIAPHPDTIFKQLGNQMAIKQVAGNISKSNISEPTM